MTAGTRAAFSERAQPAIAIALTLAAVGVEALRLAGLVVLVAGLTVGLVADRGRRPRPATTVIWGAGVLVVVTSVWSGVPLPADARDGTTCADWLAPFAVYRAVGAALVLVAVAIVLRLVGWRGTDIGARRPAARGIALAAALLVAVGLAAVAIGPALAEPYFGPLPVDLGNIAALVPALLFAVANGALEETVYRGVLLHALRRLRGIGLALVVQAVAFGLAHGVGSDFAGSPVPVMLATAVGGLGFGLIALRTGSLLLPIAIHAALDIPIYYANACLAP